MKITSLMTLTTASTLALTLVLAGCDQGNQSGKEQNTAPPPQTGSAEAPASTAPEMPASIAPETPASTAPEVPASPTPSESKGTATDMVNRELATAREKAQEAAANLKAAGEQFGAAAAKAASEALEAVRERANETTASLKQAGAEASAAAAAAASAAAEKTSELAGAMAQKSSQMTQSVGAEADELIAKARVYLEENDLDSAKGVMQKLDELKDQLPQHLKDQIDKLHQQIAEKSGSEPAG
jgi:ABC-type transporter Mla subunit MlaD